MEITHVLFDLDDTLVAEESSAEAAFLATCEHARERYGVDPHALYRAVRERAREAWFAAPTHAYCQAVGLASWEGLWARFTGDDPSLEALRRWAPAYRRVAWSRALQDLGVRDAPFAERLAAIFPAERRARHVVFPDVEDTLAALHGVWRLAVLTNGTPGLQRERRSRGRVWRTTSTPSRSPARWGRQAGRPRVRGCPQGGRRDARPHGHGRRQPASRRPGRSAGRHASVLAEPFRPGARAGRAAGCRDDQPERAAGTASARMTGCREPAAYARSALAAATRHTPRALAVVPSQPSYTIP